MTVARLCPTCGHTFDSDQALCPRCLLLGALASSASRDETRDSATGYKEPARRDATAAVVQTPDHFLNRIVTLLAEDDLGTVYLARGADRRFVTVRLMAAIGEGAEVLKRLETLRIRLADLADPCIVPIAAVGMTQDGRPFIVAEYIAGQSPLRHSKEGPAPGDVRRSGVEGPAPSDVRRSGVEGPAPSDVRRSGVEGPAPSDVRRSGVEGARLLDRVTETLVRAHRAGLVHGRLRLSNVLIVQDRGREAPRLLDFGLGPALAGEGEGDPAVDLVALEDLRSQVL